ncbi:hypothetical protein sos41_21870 [Alphaproteobacteria bacterium SO-S41]|nr:hypothetical protein sos41_21870 [Alphaproteobacteria bacterium SO-S41]
MRAEMKPTKRSAAVIALDALAFVVGDEAELGRFLSLSGLSPDRLRAGADQPDTHRAVLEYVLGHEPTARAFAEANGYRPEDLWAAAHHMGIAM